MNTHKHEKKIIALLLVNLQILKNKLSNNFGFYFDMNNTFRN